MSLTRYLARRRGASSLLAVAVLVLPSARTTTSQSTSATVILGRVADAGGLPLGAATVSIATRKIVATTAPDCRYTLVVTRTGEREQVTLRVAKAGFEPRSMAVYLSGDTVRADARLIAVTPQARELAAVDVSASAAQGGRPRHRRIDAASFLMTDYQHLVVDTSPEGIRTITLDRPDRLNAVNDALAFSVGDALADAGSDDAVRIVVITGAGRAFCAGLDLAEPPALPQATRADRLDPYAWVGTWVQRVVACEKPVIAAVNGPAAGAGFGLALACDIRLIAESAKLTAGYVRRGLSPDAGVSYFLPRHVGLARASDILLSGRDVDASEALLIGLVTMVIPDTEFRGAVASYAARLALGAPIAQALTKRLLVQSFDRTLDATLRDELTQIKVCFATKDVSEAIMAFREKRMPVFQGR